MTSSGLMNRSGCVDEALRAPCDAFEPWRVGERLGLHPRDPVERRLGDGEEAQEHEAGSRKIASEHPARRTELMTDPRRAPAGSRPAPDRASGGSSSSSARACASSAVVVRFGVVVAEHVEHAVHDQQGELVVERAGVRRRPARAATAGHTTTSPSRTGISRVESPSVVIERERQHVGGAVLAHVLAR